MKYKILTRAQSRMLSRRGFRLDGDDIWIRDSPSYTTDEALDLCARLRNREKSMRYKKKSKSLGGDKK
jgi:hypothetical protein